MSNNNLHGFDLTTLINLLRFASKGKFSHKQCIEGITLHRHADAMELHLNDLKILEFCSAVGLLTKDAETYHATADHKPFLKARLADRHDEQITLSDAAYIEKEIVDPAGNRIDVKYNRNHSSLSALARLKQSNGELYFSPALIEAGERLYADFYRGQLTPRVSSNWEPRLSQSKLRGRNHSVDLNDSAMSAKERFNLAMQSIGPELSGAVVDICCFEKGLEQVEMDRSWPKRSGKLMLRTRLQILHRHYNPQEATSTHTIKQRSIRHWATSDYRPDILNTL